MYKEEMIEVSKWEYENLKETKERLRKIINTGYIEETGYRKSYPEYGWYLNWSSIFTKLIQRVGMLVKHQGSDLYYTLRYIDVKLQDGTIENEDIFLGIRRNGVDSTHDFYKKEKDYLETWKISINIDGNNIKMELYEV